MKKAWLFMLTALLASSCFKEDEKVLPHDPGDVKSDTIAMTSTYAYQVYYDLGTAASVSSNLKSDFDLAFECADTGWRVILNTSTFAMAADAGIRAFGLPVDTAGLKFWFDRSDGNPDSTAIRKWFNTAGSDTLSNGHIYVLNRGLDEMGFNLGFRQLVIDSLKNGIYYFRVAMLDGLNPQSFAVPKDPDRNYVTFTLRFGGLVKKTEPPKNTWDLVFTQYTTLLFTDEGDPYPYIVTGVLINRSGIEVARDTSVPFQQLNMAHTASMQFTKEMDAIGYDWKYYDFDLGTYSVDTKRTYIIRDTEGFLFKLRFVGFYNASGEKGYPVIEFQQL